MFPSVGPAPNRARSGSERPYQYEKPATGFVLRCRPGVDLLILDPAGTLATGTVYLPDNPAPGDKLIVAASQIVTALTFAAQGATIVSAPTTVSAGGRLEFRYVAEAGKWFFMGGSGSVAIDGATTGADESTSSTSYTDLATVGASVTLTTGATVYLDIYAVVYRASGVGNSAFTTVAVSGATTIAASDTYASQIASAVGGIPIPTSRRVKMTGLNPGSNTFTMKYRCDGGGPWHWFTRTLVVEAP